MSPMPPGRAKVTQAMMGGGQGFGMQPQAAPRPYGYLNNPGGGAIYSLGGNLYKPGMGAPVAQAPSRAMGMQMQQPQMSQGGMGMGGMPQRPMMARPVR